MLRFRKLIVLPALAIIGLVLVGLGAGSVSADPGNVGDAVVPPGSGTGTRTDVSKLETRFATDMVYAGVGGMNFRDGGTNGTGSITIAGISGTITRAYLYWHGPTSSTDPNVNAAVTFNGSAIVGTALGISNDNCWGFTESRGYRANVTSLVSGNGTYTLANFTKSPTADVNGASLVVFYNDSSTSNNRDVVIFDGNDSNIGFPGELAGWNVSLPGINYTSGAAFLDMIVADGQAFPDDALILQGQVLAPSGAIFEGDSVPNAGQSQGLWDNERFTITSFLVPGTNNLTLTTGVNSDCLALVGALVNLPAGSAPDQPATATPSPTATSVPVAPVIGAIAVAIADQARDNRATAQAAAAPVAAPSAIRPPATGDAGLVQTSAPYALMLLTALGSAGMVVLARRRTL